MTEYDDLLKAKENGYTSEQIEQSWRYASMTLEGLKMSSPSGTLDEAVFELTAISLLKTAARMLLEDHITGAREYALAWQLIDHRLKRFRRDHPTTSTQPH